MSMITDEADRLDRQIGDRVRCVRRARKLSQGELGKALDVSFQQIQKYERGVNRISTSALMLIARALDVSPHELMGMADAAQSNMDWDLLATDGSYDLLQSYREITSPKLRRALLEMAQNLAKADAG